MGRKNKGFTLIEIALVLALISIILLIVGIRIEGVFSDAKLRSAARMISNDIRYAQQLAVANRWDGVTVFFNRDQNKYSVFYGTKTFKEENLPEGVVFYLTTFDNNRCVYNKRGNPSSSGRVFIECEGKIYTISVRVATGRVIIYDYFRKEQ